MTSDARDLLAKLLEVDPVKRLTSTEALAHPWLTVEDEFADDTCIDFIRPRSSSILKVDSTFRESFTRPTPPRKVPDAFKAEKDSSRMSVHHGMGIFRYVFGGMTTHDDKKDEKKVDTAKGPKGKNWQPLTIAYMFLIILIFEQGQYHS